MHLRGHYLPGPAGALALTLWEPEGAARGALLHLPAFGDEMNKARRMVAQQARAFAAAGIAVAALDPSGTGDSAGEHAEATWVAWREDALAALRWWRARCDAPCGLWGLRLGALLAADVASAPSVDPALLLLWQPVVSGRTFFQQFLRTASVPAGDGAPGTDRKALLARLDAGETPEVGGYALGAGLVRGAEALEIATLAPPRCPIAWLDVGAGEPPQPPPLSLRAMEAWRGAGADVDARVVAGPPFWTSVEIEEAPSLVAATTRAVVARLAVTAPGP